MPDDEKETDIPLEPGEEILKVTDKYRGDFRDSAIGFGSRTVKVVLTNRRLAILPSKWSAPVAIMKGSVLSLLKSGDKDTARWLVPKIIAKHPIKPQKQRQQPTTQRQSARGVPTNL